MAVMQNSIIFGGIDSADFGIYIGGEGTFDAPKRDAEMISIPGRNGAFALDKGRFENIEVTYSAFNRESDLATFSAQLEGFRNAICSQKGYQRLTDTFHPDEYRMAAYIDGLKIKPIEYNTAATFDIKFDCKPQRFLMSGETPITVSSGDTILNPTHFESKPMLEVEGYGAIGFNGFEIELRPQEVGDVTLWREKRFRANYTNVTKSQTVPNGMLNIGDTFTLASTKWTASRGVSAGSRITMGNPTGTVTGIDGATATAKAIVTEPTSAGAAYNATGSLDVVLPPLNFVYGTQKSVSCQISYSCTYTGGASGTITFTQTVTIAYDGDSALSITWQNSAQLLMEFGVPTATGYSSIVITGYTTYIDCDLGEAYLIRDNTPISLNRYIDLGSELPTLASGSNEITFDNTITELKVIPRWWIV